MCLVAVNNLNAIQSAFAGINGFQAKMTGAEEVPPKNTNATGTAVFDTNLARVLIDYQIHAKNIHNVTMAHIHIGKKGANGPVVLTLFHSVNETGVKCKYYTESERRDPWSDINLWI